jgi:hypothetical protein
MNQAASLFHLFFLVPPKRRLPFTGLHGVVCQKVYIFAAMALRTVNPTFLKLFRLVVLTADLDLGLI